MKAWLTLSLGFILFCQKIGADEIGMFYALERDWERLKAQSQSVDMNLFGLLSVLESYQLLHIALRIVSDAANDSASQDFKIFVTKYAGEGGELVAQLITNLPPNPNSPDSYPALKSY